MPAFVDIQEEADKLDQYMKAIIIRREPNINHDFNFDIDIDVHSTIIYEFKDMLKREHIEDEELMNNLRTLSGCKLYFAIKHNYHRDEVITAIDNIRLIIDRLFVL